MIAPQITGMFAFRTKKCFGVLLAVSIPLLGQAPSISSVANSAIPSFVGSYVPSRTLMTMFGSSLCHFNWYGDAPVATIAGRC